MIRYAILLGLVIGSTATALAHVQPEMGATQIDQMTYRNEVADVALAQSAQPLFLQKCAVEDCSDTPQN